MKIICIIIISLLVLAVLAYGIYIYTLRKRHEVFLEEIKDQERVITFFWNNKEITEEQLVNFYKNYDPSMEEIWSDYKNPARPGDIIGHRKYSYGKKVEEKIYTVIRKKNKDDLTLIFKEFPRMCSDFSDIDVIYLLKVVYEHYYLIYHQDEMEKYYNPLMTYIP